MLLKCVVGPIDHSFFTQSKIEQNNCISFFFFFYMFSNYLCLADRSRYTVDVAVTSIFNIFVHHNRSDRQKKSDSK